MIVVMRISARADYALRAAIELATAHDAHVMAGPLQRVWIALRASERAVLETITLADVVSGEF
jgi:DNA-binding IscR family transcriptional regulator